MQFRKLQGDRKFLASRIPSSAFSASYSTVASFWKAAFHRFCYYAIKLWKYSCILCYIEDNLENIDIYLSILPDEERHLSATGGEIYAISQPPATLSPMYMNNISTHSVMYKVPVITCSNCVYIYIWIYTQYNVKITRKPTVLWRTPLFLSFIIYQLPQGYAVLYHSLLHTDRLMDRNHKANNRFPSMQSF